MDSDADAMENDERKITDNHNRRAKQPADHAQPTYHGRLTGTGCVQYPVHPTPSNKVRCNAS